ncbi:hypothetical protein [Dokdonia sp. Hel_I_53]|uniref:hypothetical protein n=1 Tax=Dokdonia sp. Hel_I_53 TaxID=1566287 RepID=UPI00119AF6D7|nr:hypothetical protein [Dokdonia sp. Hel_I_53]TVZ52891.1 hypothetical protein OD90_2077 [Dokdonia sp. Hel_I_53]
MKNVYFILIFFISQFAVSQVGINTTTPISQAALQIDGSNSGLLINRVALTGKDDVTTIPSLSVPADAAAAEGLMVYNTATAGTGENTVKPGFYSWDGTGWLRFVDEDSVSRHTGWAVYNDTQFTSAAPGFVAANTSYFLPNNAGNKIESQLPTDVPTFYDETTEKITGRNGDGLNVVIEFKLRPLTNGTVRVNLSIDIGGGVGEIYPRSFVLTRGINQEHFYLSSFNAYTLGTWEANGGSVIIEATGNVEVYDIRYVLTRTHKAR